MLGVRTQANPAAEEISFAFRSSRRNRQHFDILAGLQRFPQDVAGGLARFEGGNTNALVRGSGHRQRMKAPFADVGANIEEPAATIRILSQLAKQPVVGLIFAHSLSRTHSCTTVN